MQEQQRMMKGLAVVSIAALIAKVLSAIYRVPFQNLAGDVGFYVYQQIYPLYGIVMVLSMYGLPVALSRKRVELLELGKKKEARQLTALFFYSLLLMVVLIWLIIYFQAGTIATIMGDSQLKEPLQAMSYILFVIPFLSVGRGYAQSEGELISTAVSHIGEQIIRVSVIIGLTVYSVYYGFDAYQIGAGAAYGSWIGAGCGVFLLLIMTRGNWFKQVWIVQTNSTSFKQLLPICLSLVKHSFYICMSVLVLILFQLVDAFTIVRLLESSGMDSLTAYIEKAVYDRGQPLIQVGAVLTTTFTLALVPMITKAVTAGQPKEAKRHQQTAFRLTFLIAGAATIGLFIIMNETNHMLFTDGKGSDVLRVLVLVILLQSLFITMSAIYQGYSFLHLPFIAVLVGLAIKIAGQFLFVTHLGVMGAAWSTVIGFVCMLVYLMYNGYKRRILSFGRIRSYSTILVVLIGLAVVSFAFKQWLILFIQESNRLYDTLIAVSTSFVGMVVVMVTISLLPVFSKSEWEMVPALNKMRAIVMKRR
ncbi:oligosaccharide flippase family protein [Halalkalibacter sp. AB-rgal2]|uniref:putative polysaccharide biosynthesis protein n=1 Tax=Halalkalibacter sp. AB-rgal2 TaxID=3242695 RepID=UPI00359D26F3